MNIETTIEQLKTLGVTNSGIRAALKKNGFEVDEIDSHLPKETRTTVDWETRTQVVRECVSKGLSRKETIQEMIDSGVWGGKATATQFAASIDFCKEWAKQESH